MLPLTIEMLPLSDKFVMDLLPLKVKRLEGVT